MTTKRYIEARRELAAIRASEREHFEARVRAEYARRRAADRAAGRDTSGRSVAARRQLAHDAVMLDPDESTLLARVRIDELERETR